MASDTEVLHVPTEHSSAHGAPTEPGTPAASPVPGKPNKPKRSAPHPIQRLIFGLIGMGLLVGFFLPWFHTMEGETPRVQSGLDLASLPHLAGTPSPLLFVLPSAGVILTITSLMGFLYASELAIAIALLLFGYGVYVAIHLLGAHAGIGVWVVLGTQAAMFLGGVLAIFVRRRSAQSSNAQK